MKTFTATQQALADADYKTVSWFFEVSNAYVDYDAQTGTFTVGNSVYGGTSGATATIEKIERLTATTGRLHLSGILGTFEDDEVIYEATYGSELVTNGDCSVDIATTLGTGWSHDAVAEEYDCDGSQIAASDFDIQSVTNEYLSFYIHRLTIKNYSAGGVKMFGFSGGEASLSYLTTNGIKTYIEQSTYNNTTTTVYIKADADFVGSVDDISRKQITNAALVNGAQGGDVYYWSTKGYEGGSALTFGATSVTFGVEDIVFGNTYTYKILKDSFDGIRVTSPLSQFGIYAPNELNFEITNADSALTASYFKGCRVLLSLAMESDSSYAVMRQWKYVVERAMPIYKTIRFECKDFIAEAMEGDYPSTPMASDLFAIYGGKSSPFAKILSVIKKVMSGNIKDSEPFCVPVPFGTCYIPLKVVPYSSYVLAYLLGPDEYTYTISEVSSPRYFDAAQTWESTDAYFSQITKADRFTPSSSYKIFIPYLTQLDDYNYSGTHTGANDAETLTDSTKSWTVDSLIYRRIFNTTDVSYGVITDNDGTTITADLAGGTGNDWDTGDAYTIQNTGIWVADGEYQNLLVKFSRSDTSSTTSPSDVIEWVLEDMGIGSGNIDTGTGSTFATAETTYSGWSLAFNGAFYYRQKRTQVIATLLNSCHSTLDIDSKVQLRVLSKTSQKTLTDADILKGSFNHSFLTKSEYDSGQVTWQESGRPQDVFQKLTVPCKETYDHPASELLELFGVAGSTLAQKLGRLYYQRKFLRESRETFTTKSNCLALQPNDVITLNDALYGPSHDVLIESLHIHRDCSISFDAIKYSLALDDFDDLSPSAVTENTDSNEAIWKPVIAGPNNVAVGSGSEYTNLLPGDLRVGDTSSYIYIDSIYPYVGCFSSDVEKVRTGNLNGLLDYSTDIFGFAALKDANNYVAIDPTNGIRVSASSANAITIKAGGDILFESETSDVTGYSIYKGNSRSYYVGAGYDDDILCIFTDTDGSGKLLIGYSVDNTTLKRPSEINMYAKDTIMLKSENSVNEYCEIITSNNGTLSQVMIYAVEAAGQCDLKVYCDASVKRVSLNVDYLSITETAASVANLANSGQLYTKSDNELYFMDGDGNEFTIDKTAVP